MPPRRPHPRLVPALLLSLVGLGGCGESSTPTGTDPRTTSTEASTPDAAPGPDARTAQPAPGKPEGRLPDGLPLDLGLDRAEQWTDFRLEGPGRDVDGVPMTDFCAPDPASWPGPVSDRLAVRETGPEYEQSRELLLHPDPASARRALDDLRAAVESCPQVLWRPGEESPEDRLNLVLEPVGEDVLTVGVHYRGVLGSGVYQVRRVGRTLLAARELGEGDRGSLREGARRMTFGLDRLLDVIGADLP